MSPNLTPSIAPGVAASSKGVGFRGLDVPSQPFLGRRASDGGPSQTGTPVAATLPRLDLAPMSFTRMHSKDEEFVALMHAAGWSQADTARRLHISAAAVLAGKWQQSGSTNRSSLKIGLVRIAILPL